MATLQLQDSMYKRSVCARMPPKKASKEGRQEYLAIAGRCIAFPGAELVSLHTAVLPSHRKGRLAVVPVLFKACAPGRRRLVGCEVRFFRRY